MTSHLLQFRAPECNELTITIGHPCMTNVSMFRHVFFTVEHDAGGRAFGVASFDVARAQPQMTSCRLYGKNGSENDVPSIVCGIVRANLENAAEEPALGTALGYTDQDRADVVAVRAKHCRF